MPNETQLISDLIQLPERVTKGDFVLKLTEGVTDPKGTLGNYVVTDDLVGDFGDALDFIRGAVDSKKSKGTYLHGSFGSGKSHFMAVLNLLLSRNEEALSLPKLAPVVSKHNEWLSGKNFLMISYHMIGASSLEDAIFSGYIAWQQKNHPEADLPPLFRSGAIFENAAQLRQTMGDATFFEALNKGKGGGDDDGWGELSVSWDAARYDEAASDPTSDDHAQLVSDLVANLITSIRQEGEFLDLDRGLALLSRHAKGLGYDAVILFLDELVLWLASRSGNVNFLNQEVNKLAKLVEAQDMDRPVPIISFIARQRDLRELIGDNVTGAQNLNFLDQLKYFEGRFETIKLGDNNLPEIVAERILKPVNKEARASMDTEFQRTQNELREMRDILLTSKADPEAFRKLYPFSPALVDTLVAVSSLLQRERTALKIMLQLLVDNRTTLKLGEIVPVGDLYDQIAQGDDAFSSDMKRHFQTADKLYRQHLRPMLESTNGLSFEQAEGLPKDNPDRVRLRNEDRLIKTILLASLAEVEALKNLTPQRLAALNHGTIKSPIPGTEANIVLSKLEEWAGHVGQLKLSDATPPTVTLQVSEVDVESIIAKADSQDNFGNRLRLIKETLYEQLEIQEGGELFSERKFNWRGTDRRCTILFRNVWEADSDTLEADGENWKLVIDYPIDQDETKSPAADLARLAEFEQQKGSTRTVVWLPSFFSDQAQRDLGKLVKLQHVLSPHGFDGYVDDLSQQDRQTAKSMLESQCSALKGRLLTNIQTAYGLRSDKGGVLDAMKSLEGHQHFQSLDAGLELHVPAETHLKGAMETLLDQALGSQFPAHPKFDEEAKLTATYLQRVLDAFEGALQEEGTRYEVEKTQRGMVRMIAGPLKLGEMAQTHFVPGEHWKDHFRRMAPNGLDGVKVSDLREWIDQPDAWGLPKLLENLIILCVASQLNCSFSRHGAPAGATLKDLKDDCVLKTQQLPSPDAWDKARGLAEKVLGIAKLPKLLTPQALDEFSASVHKEAESHEAKAGQLLSQLEAVAASAGGSFDRVEAARDAKTFLELVKKGQGGSLVDSLAGFAPGQPAEAIASSLKQADAVLAVLPVDRKALDDALSLGGEPTKEAKVLEKKLEGALERNEYVIALAPIVREVNAAAVDILTKVAKREVTPDPAPPKPKPDDVPVEVPQREEIKKGRTKSYVSNDTLPDWVTETLCEELLETCTVTGSERPIVVTPTLHKLLRQCPDAVLDPQAGTISIPSKNLTLEVEFE